MKRTSVKNKCRRLFQVMTMAVCAITVLAACANPSGGSWQEEEKTPEEKTPEEVLEDKYLDRKIEIFNKMLGDWESPIYEDGRIDNATNLFHGKKEILHIEPKKWVMSAEGEQDVVLMTWEEPFYKYMYVYEEYTQEGFSNDKHSISERERKLDLFNKKDSIYLHLNCFVDARTPKNIIGTSNIDNELYFEFDYCQLIRSKKTDSGNSSDNTNKGENYKIDGSWNYEVAGEANAGGTVTFNNGNIKFKHKTGSMTSEATYTLSGNDIYISFMSFTEQFTIKEENSNKITLEFKGTGFSQILAVYFETTNKSITLTK